MIKGRNTMSLKKTIPLLALSALVSQFEMTPGVTCAHGSELTNHASVPGSKLFRIIKDTGNNDLRNYTENDTINNTLPQEAPTFSYSGNRVNFNGMPTSASSPNTIYSVLFICFVLHKYITRVTYQEPMLPNPQGERENVNAFFENFVQGLPDREKENKQKAELLNNLIEKYKKPFQRFVTNSHPAKL